MHHKPLFIIFLLSLLAFSSCYSQKNQQYYSSSKKAIKLYENAIDLMKIGKPERAEETLKLAIAKDPNFIDAFMVLGDIYSSKKNDEAALGYYKKALSINESYYPKLLYMTAEREMSIEKFGDAAVHLRSYLQSENFDNTLHDKVLHDIDICDFASELMKHPVAFNPTNLGENINSEFDEYVNSLNTENKMMIFTVKHPSDMNSGQRSLVEDFFFANKDESDKWKFRQMLGKKFNSVNDEGAMVISPDGRLIVFASNRSENFGRFDLFYSVKNGDSWSDPVNMGEGVNSAYWESQPSISSDGKTIYFVSNRKGGFGGSDIYKVTLNENGTYGNLTNLGSKINTSKNEMTPFIHPDGQSLYFVSNGHLGMGGTDIFYSKLDANGGFSDPINIGYPINSKDNEMGILIDSKGTLAYISSDKYGGKGGFDIYNFELYKEARPTPVTYSKGIAFDKETHVNLKVSFDLIDLKTGKIWIHSTSDPTTGEFIFCIPQGQNFALNTYLEGYLFYSENFKIDIIKPADKPFIKNVPMSKIKVGESIVLENVFFASNSFNLNPESNVELEKVFNLLTNNPSLKVQIAGFTDNVGSPNDNKILSENRAKVVYNFLVNKGISTKNLSFIGYGEQSPIDSNDNEEGRQKNRRTEMKVTAF
ncbi:MAG: hypothetical protein AUJ98_07355 [Bacteroidetes bacterium CG2_30_33_31]|nr:MAG: hypothetical protein AUJ98_07355 [Bacteroidetes bacterium CG2_30_33_31]